MYAEAATLYSTESLECAYYSARRGSEHLANLCRDDWGEFGVLAGLQVDAIDGAGLHNVLAVQVGAAESRSEGLVVTRELLAAADALTEAQRLQALSDAFAQVNKRGLW